MKTCEICKHFNQCEPWKTIGRTDTYAEDCLGFELKTNFENVTQSPQRLAQLLDRVAHSGDEPSECHPWCPRQCKYSNCQQCFEEWLNKEVDPKYEDLW